MLELSIKGGLETTVTTYWPSTAIISRISTKSKGTFLSLSFRLRSSSIATRKAPTATG